MLKGKLALAYTAGILDGEGCISAYKTKAKRPNYQMYVNVSSTDEWLARWLQMQYGGHAGVIPRHGNQRDLWRWNIYGKKAQEFLTLILPYLQLKRTEAELAIQFQEAKSNKKSPESLALLEANRILISKMNQNKER